MRSFIRTVYSTACQAPLMNTRKAGMATLSARHNVKNTLSHTTCMSSIKSYAPIYQSRHVRSYTTGMFQPSHKKLDVFDFFRRQKDSIRGAFMPPHPAKFPTDYYWYKLVDGNYFATTDPIRDCDLVENSRDSYVIQYLNRYLPDYHPNEIFMDEDDPEGSPSAKPKEYTFAQYHPDFFVAFRNDFQQ